MDVVLFPDAVAVACTWLADQLDDRDAAAPVFPRIPTDRPARFVVVQRTGGERLNIVADDPVLTIDCYDTVEEDAHDLAQLVRGLMYAMRGQVVAGTTVYRVQEAAGPALLPDSLTDGPRYTQTFQVAMRGGVEST